MIQSFFLAVGYSALYYFGIRRKICRIGLYVNYIKILNGTKITVFCKNNNLNYFA